MNISAPQLFAALSHETRLRCLMLLKGQPELCVCELTDLVGAPQPSISRHLALLRRLGLLLDRRDGHWIHYRLNPELPTWVLEILRTTIAAAGAVEPFASDRRALAAMRADSSAPLCARRSEEPAPFQLTPGGAGTGRSATGRKEIT